MDAEDVKYSWEAFSATNNSRGEMLNAHVADGAVPLDDRAGHPYGSVQACIPRRDTLWQLAFQRYMWLMPREAGGKFDPKLEMRGNGPWHLQKWEPSVGYTFTAQRLVARRPEAAVPRRYADDHHFRVRTAPRSAERGQLCGLPIIRAEDVMAVKGEQPKLGLYAQEFPVTRRNMIGFGYNPGSPFHDVRVRRAVSMVLERDAWVDAFYNVSGFAKDGLEVEPRWDSHYMAGDAPHWKDPKGTELGEGAQYFKHNVAEAKKLMQAAGHNAPLVTPGWFNTNVQGGETQVQSLLGMLNDSGLFNISLQGFPNAEWNLKFHTIQGKHDGIAFNAEQRPERRHRCAHQRALQRRQRFSLLGPGGLPLVPEDAGPDRRPAQGAGREEARHSAVDLQKEMALQMPAVPWPGAANGLHAGMATPGELQRLGATLGADSDDRSLAEVLVRRDEEDLAVRKGRGRVVIPRPRPVISGARGRFIPATTLNRRIDSSAACQGYMSGVQCAIERGIEGSSRHAISPYRTRAPAH